MNYNLNCKHKCYGFLWPKCTYVKVEANM